MSSIESTSRPSVSWPSNGVSEVLYAIHTDSAQHDSHPRDPPTWRRQVRAGVNPSRLRQRENRCPNGGSAVKRLALTRKDR